MNRGRETDRQTDRDRQADRQTDRDRKREFSSLNMESVSLHMESACLSILILFTT